ncbi:MAG: hypothetical protein HYZ45_00155 [Burkholderiales bacterium]|nr:hypothetical protein [Burkholderiales bacterium]
MDYFDPDSIPGTEPHRWLMLENIQEIEAWMDLNDRELRKLLADKPGQTQGQGICFSLLHGGEIYVHSTETGDILLDVTADAAWVAPVISAATRVAPPAGQVWALPQGSLLPLILGLNSLIATSHLVLEHRYRGAFAQRQFHRE